ncbi:MAG: ABC transporter permease subunit [Acidimicrobiia bacterium]|nr:ABC transporter permease subunit [Acidimicrobiia bacterium]
MTVPGAGRAAPSRPPPWRDVRVLRWAFQLVVLALVLGALGVLLANVRANSDRLGIPTGFGYLDNPAQFPIPDSDFRQTQPVQDAILLGLGNTLRVSLLGIVAATVLGTLVGVARLSGNWLVRNAARLYVEALRNIPLLLLIIFSYLNLALVVFPRVEAAWQPLGLAVVSNRGVSVPWFDGSGWPLAAGAVVGVLTAWALLRWRGHVHDETGVPAHSARWALPALVLGPVAGWLIGGLSFTVPELDERIVTGGIRMSPEYFAILFALVIYTASHIAEIVRGSIQAVDRGQTEAARALALSGRQRLWFVVLPQAFRIAVPPLGNQYLNLLKNSTLGAVVSYYELSQVTSIAVGNGAPAVPSYLLTLAIFIVLSLGISFVMNLVNRRLALVER